MIENRNAASKSGWYLLAEIIVVLGLGMILVEAVRAPVIFASIWGRLYHPARTVAMLGFVAWLLSRTGQRWRDLGLRRPDSWLNAILIGIAAFFAGFVINQIVEVVVMKLGLPKSGDIHLFLRIEGNIGEYLYWLIAMAFFVAGVGEEMIGRGYLISRFETMFGSGRAALWGAVVVSSLLFGAAHASLGLSGVIQATVGGLVLSITYILSKRNLWPCIIAHTLTDSMAFTIIFFGGAKMFTA